MAIAGSIFWNFNLPNSTTWFYFSFLLAVALFFKFSRWLSMRNWDVVTLFMLVPGFLLLQEARQQRALEAASLAGSALAHPAAVSASTTAVAVAAPGIGLNSQQRLWLGYVVLLLGSGYLFFRCLADLLLVQRPALAPNLNFGGLAWLAGALFICLMAVAYRPPEGRGHSAADLGTAGGDIEAPVGPEGPMLTLAQDPFADDPFDFQVRRTFAVLCHLAVVAGLVVLGYRHFQDAHAGMAAATLYLMLPYTGLHVGQAHHIWPMALVVWSLVSYRWPLVTGFLLGLASATAVFPVLVAPLWASFYWKRGIGRFIATLVLTAAGCLIVTGIILFIRDQAGDRTGIFAYLASWATDALTLHDWQPWLEPATEGFWRAANSALATGVQSAYRIPVFIAYLGFVLLTACWPMPKNLAHVIALSAAVFIGIQFWYADQGGVYVLWYLPLLTLLVFRPNLAEHRPPIINPDTDWLARARRALARFASRWFKPSEPLVRVP